MKEKVILAYSGGLDTTAIIPWLKENFDYEVICVCADCGLGTNLTAFRKELFPVAHLNYTLRISLMNSVMISSFLAYRLMPYMRTNIFSVHQWQDLSLPRDL